MVVAACRVVVEVEAPNWIRRGSAFLFLLLLLLLLPHEFISRSQLQFFPSSLSSLLPHSYFEIIPKLMTSQTPSRGITPTIDQSITPISLSLILRFAWARFQDEAWKQGMIFFSLPVFFPFQFGFRFKATSSPDSDSSHCCFAACRFQQLISIG